MKHSFDEISNADLDRLGSDDEWLGGSSYRNGSDGDDWGEPDLALLGTGRRPAPAFPIAILGPWAEWAQAEAKAASAPVDYVACSLLTCAGAALANVRWPLAGADWTEPTVLNIGLVGGPGASKSPGMDRAFALVRHAEDEMAEGFDLILTDHATRKQVGEASLAAWKAEVAVAVKAGEEPPPMPADTNPPAPVRPRIRIADATVEKMAALAAGLPRGLVLVRDELAGFLGGLDRYSGKGSDRAFVLEMYGGRSYVVDRVKNPEPITIRHLSIGVLGGIQPERLSDVIDGPDDGLVGRFLWCWPEIATDFRLGRERQDDTQARAGFARLTRLAMAQDRLGNLEPKTLPLHPRAEALLEKFAQEMGRRADEATGLFASTLSKARGHALRLAAILDHIWFAIEPTEEEPEEIGEPAMRAAIDLVRDCFLPMAARVFGDLVIPMPERRAMHLARHLRRNGLVSFNARTTRHELGGLVRDADDMAEACAVLVDGNLIRPAFKRAGETKGRPAKLFDVNPVVARPT